MDARRVCKCIDTNGKNEELVKASHRSWTEPCKIAAGASLAGFPRSGKMLSCLYNGRVYYAVGRSVVSVPVGFGDQEASIEYITTAESSISAMHINMETILVGTLSGEVIGVSLKNQVLFKRRVESTVYSLLYAPGKIFFSLMYKMMAMEYRPGAESAVCVEGAGTVLQQMNDIVQHISVVQAKDTRVVAYASTDTLFVNSQMVKYVANVVFMQAVLTGSGAVRIVTGLTNRRIYIYEYENDQIVLKNLVYTCGMISGGVVLEDMLVAVLTDSISIYACGKNAERLCMLGPYNEDIVKVFVKEPDTSAGGKGRGKCDYREVVGRICIALGTGGIFGYMPSRGADECQLRSPKTLGEKIAQKLPQEEHALLETLHSTLSEMEALTKSCTNVASGNLARIKDMHTNGKWIVTASGPTTRVFSVEGGRIVEVFRPTVDGFPINAVVPDWNGSFLINSNNILKVYTPTQIYRMLARGGARAIQQLIERYNSLLEECRRQGPEARIGAEAKLLQNALAEVAGGDAESKDPVPFTAVKQELSLSTIPQAPCGPEEREYILSTIRSEPGLSANHFLEVDKVYGFPFEISTFVKAKDTMLLVSCKSSQKAFSNVFVLNKSLEIVQKVHVHAKTVTHIFVSGETVLTLGKDRRAAVYRIACEQSALPKSELTEWFKPGDFGLVLLDSRIDHKKEILAGHIGGSTVITSSKDKTINTYAIEDSALVLKHTETVQVPITSINSVSVRIDAPEIVMGDADGDLHLGGKVYKAHNREVTHIGECTGPERYLVTASGEGILKAIPVQEFE
ncbi:uncharacterized protein NEMAJ01_0156 [Nematocida major]|uniref:uncharacterized protein n=1 Tax=Nematocida major TaxID=1912982 RepID=UPI002008DFB9|nr:uncharacterized protein NEMAJ01_0156 [Nematocida major]KAH9385260.1 hypothetical protein NEMAJ01_0156 [Nematocida major]